MKFTGNYAISLVPGKYPHEKQMSYMKLENTGAVSRKKKIPNKDYLLIKRFFLYL